MGMSSHWATSSFGDSTEPSTNELAALRAHLAQCTPRHAKWVAMQCGAIKLRGLVGARLITTVALLVALLSVGLSLVL